MRPAGQRLLNPAMLIAERDFQMQHFLARALETKMSRLDDAGMDRAYGNLVNFAAVHPEKFAVGRRIPRCAPHGLEPRMPLGCEAMLLPDFALEQMRLRVGGSQCGIRVGKRLTPPDRERIVGVEGQHGDEAGARIFRHAKPRA